MPAQSHRSITAAHDHVPSFQEGRDGWLVSAPHRLVTPHRYAAPDPRIQPVDVVVLHYTASPWQAAAAEEARVRRWLRGEGRESSTHFVILRSGLVLQGMPLTDRAWHVVNKYPYQGRPLNDRSIGIDFANVGHLQRTAEGKLVDAYGGHYLGPAPFIDGRGKPWEPINEAQVRAAEGLLGRLGQLFPCLRGADRLIGHTDVQPTRPDPGPACPRERLVAALRGG